MVKAQGQRQAQRKFEQFLEGHVSAPSSVKQQAVPESPSASPSGNEKPSSSSVEAILKELIVRAINGCVEAQVHALLAVAFIARCLFSISVVYLNIRHWTLSGWNTPACFLSQIILC